MLGFCDLHKFKLCTKDDDGFANMHEVCTVLNQNQGTLVHLPQVHTSCATTLGTLHSSP